MGFVGSPSLGQLGKWDKVGQGWLPAVFRIITQPYGQKVASGPTNSRTAAPWAPRSLRVSHAAEDITLQPLLLPKCSKGVWCLQPHVAPQFSLKNSSWFVELSLLSPSACHSWLNRARRPKEKKTLGEGLTCHWGGYSPNHNSLERTAAIPIEEIKVWVSKPYRLVAAVWLQEREKKKDQKNVLKRQKSSQVKQSPSIKILHDLQAPFVTYF